MAEPSRINVLRPPCGTNFPPTQMSAEIIRRAQAQQSVPRTTALATAPPTAADSITRQLFEASPNQDHYNNDTGNVSHHGTGNRDHGNHGTGNVPHHGTGNQDQGNHGNQDRHGIGNNGNHNQDNHDNHGTDNHGKFTAQTTRTQLQASTSTTTIKAPTITATSETTAPNKDQKPSPYPPSSRQLDPLQLTLTISI